MDRRFSEEIVKVLSPLGIRASLEATDRFGLEQEARYQATQRRVEQLSYETARAFEQYDEVDPRNRLVASELERRWNEKLEEIELVRGTSTELEYSRQQPTTEERERLMTLARNFGDVWNDPACPAELKKKIVRTLIEEVLVDEDPPGKLAFIIHWKGGSHTCVVTVVVVVECIDPIVFCNFSISSHNFIFCDIRTGYLCSPSKVIEVIEVIGVVNIIVTP